MTETSNNELPASTGPAKIVYILYLVSILVGITAIVGLIIAYVNRDDAPALSLIHISEPTRPMKESRLP